MVDGGTGEERAWAKATALVRENHPGVKEDSEQFFALTMTAFERMGYHAKAAYLQREQVRKPEATTVVACECGEVMAKPAIEGGIVVRGVVRITPDSKVIVACRKCKKDVPLGGRMVFTKRLTPGSNDG